MHSNEEKQNFLVNIIRKIETSTNVSDLQRELFNFLIEDTGGKVYKYRSCDRKGFSFSNLMTGTLYCSRPSSFNDPFDCKIGIDVQSLVNDRLELDQNKIGELFENFISVYYGESEISDYPQSNRNVIEYWLNSDVIMTFIQHLQQISSEQEIINVIQENGNILVEILCGIISCKTLCQELSINSKMISDIIQKIRFNYTIKPCDNDFSYTDFAKSNGIYDDVDEIALICLLVDKLFPENRDAVKKFKDKCELMNAQLKEKFDNLFLIGCLADDYKNRLMWSHYADSHKGFCIEYDYNNTDNIDIVPWPVIYSDKRIKMPWKAVIKKTKENMANATETMMLALLTKDKMWSYENEWRVLISDKANPNVKMPCISCIYIGALCSENNKRKIRRMAKELSIPVKQMKIDHGEYMLHAE